MLFELQKPPIWYTDKALEFKNEEYNLFIKKDNIKLYHTQNEENTVDFKVTTWKQSPIQIICE